MIIKGNGHDIVFGKLGSSDLLKRIAQLRDLDKVFIITDSVTSKICLPYFFNSIKEFADFPVLEFESGEENKTIDTCKYIWQALLEMGATRKSLIINIGGGVVTDLGGFVAGTYQRGISYINIPTTLLAQADASVGAKVAVDLDGYKNQVGLFYDPIAVFIDVNFLSTLSKREWLNGYAEMLKHALLQSRDAWNRLTQLSITDAKALEEELFKSVQFKSNIVLDDKNESGLRKILNFGHTVGHAIETMFLENDHFQLKHGEAIIAGMIIECLIAEEKIGLPAHVTQEIIHYFNSFYQPVKLDKTDFVRLIQIMKTDKKNRGDEINFTLLQDIGKPLFNQSVNAAEIERALMRYRAI